MFFFHFHTYSSYLNLISHPCLFSPFFAFSALVGLFDSEVSLHALVMHVTFVIDNNLKFEFWWLLLHNFYYEFSNVTRSCILFLYIKIKNRSGFTLCLHYSWYTDKFVLSIFLIFLHDVMMWTLIPWIFSSHATVCSCRYFSFFILFVFRMQK